MVAIRKPPGYFVHRSTYDGSATEVVLQNLRDQLGQRVYPVHRLDRKTSGLLILALDKEVQTKLSYFFQEKMVQKLYLALVRGNFQQEVLLDYPLLNEKGKIQQAATKFTPLITAELPFASSSKYSTSRYSLVSAEPITGRQHQIRRHLAHLRYPIIGDRPYGCSKQNKYFLETWQTMRMYLHAFKLVLPHPISGEKIEITVPPDEEFTSMLDVLHLNLSTF